VSTLQLVSRAFGWSVLLSIWQGAMIALLCALLLRVLGGSPQFRRNSALAGQLIMVVLLFGSTIALFELWRPLGETALPRSLPRFSGQANAVALASALVSERPGLVGMLRRADIVAMWVSALWLSGAVLAGSVLLLRYSITRKILTSGQRRDDLQPRVRAIAAQLGVRAPVATVQARFWTPAVVGWRQPVVVLPEYAERVLSSEQLDAVLAHELAHVHRRDHALQLLECMIGCIFFFHPAVHYLQRISNRSREEACDDLAVKVCGNVLVYARALERLESARSWIPRAMAAAVSLDNGELLGRVRRLLEPTATRPALNRFAISLGSISACALLLAFSVPAAIAPAVPVARLQNQWMRIRAADPAGRFTVTMVGGRVLGATIDGELVVPDRMSQDGDELHFLRSDGSTDFTVNLRSDGINWIPRKAPVPPG
jgi:bla regulator protein BlaR1